jgi:hypothetical protein
MRLDNELRGFCTRWRTIIKKFVIIWHRLKTHDDLRPVRNSVHAMDAQHQRETFAHLSCFLVGSHELPCPFEGKSSDITCCLDINLVRKIIKSWNVPEQ